jgi:hypothetical protein
MMLKLQRTLHFNFAHSSRETLKNQICLWGGVGERLADAYNINTPMLENSSEFENWGTAQYFYKFSTYSSLFLQLNIPTRHFLYAFCLYLEFFCWLVLGTILSLI